MAGVGTEVPAAWRYERRRADVVRLLASLPVLAITAWLAHGTLPSWEITVFTRLNKGTDALYWPIWTVMQLGTLIAIPITAAVALAFRHARLAANLAISGTTAYLFALVVKHLVDRSRPADLLAGVNLHGHVAATGLGFPSGHAAVATALAVAVFPYLHHRAGRVAVWSAALVVSGARIYVGAHFPLDVIGGAVLGTAVGSAVHLMIGAPSELGGNGFITRWRPDRSRATG